MLRHPNKIQNTL